MDDITPPLERIPDGDPADEPEVVCLCGSTRFKEAWEEERLRLTMEGKIVVSVSFYGHADGVELTAHQKSFLDKLHKRKIDLADRVHVINKDGYVGESTRSEIAYAKEHGLPVTWYEEPTEELLAIGE